MPTLPKGIRPKHNRWEVRKRGVSTTFPRTSAYPTPSELAVMRAWQAAQTRTRPSVESGSVAAEIAAYNAHVATNDGTLAAMVTRKQRAAHLQLWALALRDADTRPLTALTAREIGAVLAEWSKTHAPGTVRRRRQALHALYVWRFGKGGINPVRETVNPREPDPAPRGLPMDVVDAILANMATRRPGSHRTPALAPLRAAVVAYTGIPPGLLMQLRPTSIERRHGKPYLVHVPRRIKGRGVAARPLQLTADGASALDAFDRGHAYGPYAITSVNTAVKRAVVRLGLDPSIHLYDLRHSFLSEIYRTTKDEATVGRFAIHSVNSRTARRYTGAAFDDVDADAVAHYNQRQIERRRGAIREVAR